MPFLGLKTDFYFNTNLDKIGAFPLQNLVALSLLSMFVQAFILEKRCAIYIPLPFCSNRVRFCPK